MINKIATVKTTSKTSMRKIVFDIASISILFVFLAFTFLKYGIQKDFNLLIIFAGIIIYYFAYMGFYTSRLEAGKQRGRINDDYLSAVKKHNEAVSRVQNAKDNYIVIFRDGCTLYSKKVYENEVYSYIYSAGFSKKEYEERFKNLSKKDILNFCKEKDPIKRLSKKQCKNLIRATQVEFKLLTIDELMTEQTYKPLNFGKSERELTATAVFSKAIKWFLPSIIFNLFYFTLTDGNLKDIILKFILQAGLIIAGGFMGEVKGYTIISEDMRTRCVHKADTMCEIEALIKNKTLEQIQKELNKEETNDINIGNSKSISGL